MRWRLRKQYRATMRAFDRIIGLERLHVFHINDSKKACGSRVDRHAHIGEGHLGLEGFRHLVNDRRFRNHAMILETAKEGPNDEVMDAINLQALRGLMKKSATGKCKSSAQIKQQAQSGFRA